MVWVRGTACIWISNLECRVLLHIVCVKGIALFIVLLDIHAELINKNVTHIQILITEHLIYKMLILYCVYTARMPSYFLTPLYSQLSTCKLFDLWIFLNFSLLVEFIEGLYTYIAACEPTFHLSHPCYMLLWVCFMAAFTF